jgi:ABC-type glycerol-3-phosphate transport system substrate-binding protein
LPPKLSENKNPNQNFLVAPLPQVKNSNFKLNSAHVTGVAVMSSSKNLTTAFTAAGLMASVDFASKFAKALAMPPARRDLLSVRPTDAFSPIFYDGALYAKSWLDPSPVDTDNIFGGMIDSILSNKMQVGEAINDAGAKLGLLLTKFR